MEWDIIRNAHDAGHFATQKTMHNIKQNYFIPHLESKVSKYINNCVRCIIFNKKLGKKEGYLHCIDKTDGPLNTLHIDHLGPMDSTSKQYKYVFAIVDGFSKFVWLFPTKTTGVEEKIRRLSEWTDIFGSPSRLVSDKGAAFTSQMFAEFCRCNNIEHATTTTGVARGNGQVERINRSILAIIAKLSANDPTKWYKFVGKVQKAINSHVHSSTKFTPFQIMFGVNMKNDISSGIMKAIEEEMFIEFDEERRKMREEAKLQIEQAQQTYKKNFDKKRKDELNYRVNDLVAIKRTQFVAGKKLASEYLGPYKVIKVKNNGRYDVEKVSPGEGPIKTSTSCDNMKPWKYVDEEGVLSSETNDEQEGRM